MRETDLYQPIKSLFEEKGYEVKGEITDCDLVARKEGQSPIIVELKLNFNIQLVFQGIRRQALTDQVYLAVAKGPSKGWRKSYKDVVKLCRLLGFGLIAVKFYKSKAPKLEVHLEPGPYQPRQSPKKLGQLIKEFEARTGDPNVGGSTGKPLVTAYRQDALRCLAHLSKEGPTKASIVAKQSQVSRAAKILYNNHYGWFEKVDRGIYAASESGSQASKTYQSEIEALTKGDSGED